jgi:hypothetical protein
VYLVILKTLLPIHVLAGAVALCCFWIPLVTAKGGKVHRRAGWVFVTTMAIAAITAWVICGIRYSETDDVHQRAAAAFLAYVGLLATDTSWNGLRALRFKNRTVRHFHPVDIGIPLLLVLSGAGVLVYGIQVNMPLLTGFAPVGVLVGILDLAYWLRPPQERMHWWYQHMASMIGTCIATLTAFLVNNVSMLGFQSPSVILAVFLAPTLVGVPGMWFWQRYYRARFRRKELATAGTGDKTPQIGVP